MLIKDIRNLVLDMDGVLWRGMTPMPGLVAFFTGLREREIDFVLATNNASKTLSQYVAKLAGFGVAIAAEQIVTSAEATGSYLQAQYGVETAVYVIGDEGLHEAVQKRGFPTINPTDVRAGATASVVVMGFTRRCTYDELAMGSLLVSKGATFIGTNPDVSFPHELGQLPGAGALQAVITTATGVKPTVIGKPGPIMFQEAMKRLGSTPTDTAMVGDRLGTDIAGGQAAGMYTILVLTGISRQADLVNSTLQPDYIFADITELLQSLA